MKFNKKSLLLIISVLVLAVLTFSITYSYFASNKSTNGTLSINATTSPGSYTLIIDSSDDLSFNLEPQFFYSSHISSEPVASENTTISLALSSPDYVSTTLCKYDVIFEWTSLDQYLSIPDIELPYTNGDIKYPYLFSIKANKTVNFDISKFNYTDTNMTEIDLSKLTWSKEEGEENNTSILFTGQIASRATEATIVNWNFESNIYNIPIDQNFIASKNYEAKIFVDNIKCRIFKETPENIDLLDEV